MGLAGRFKETAGRGGIGVCFPALGAVLIGRGGLWGAVSRGKGWAGWLIRHHSVQSKAVGNQQEPT
ncbi:MAG: hypothetical protein KA469_03255 [Phycisphaerae bacterium]|nr:hypothetical protein [Phycisphaerae bacterium]